MCKYCESRDFTPLNSTTDYSGIEMSLNDQGILRVRSSSIHESGTNAKVTRNQYLFDSQDIVNIKYCPMCGRRFDGRSIF